MTCELKGKVSIVTGAGAGIGRAIALLFASQGAKVIVNDKLEDAGQESTNMITKRGGMAYFAFGDVSTSGGSQTVVNQVTSEFGKIDILINNAGGKLGVEGNLSDLSEEAWDKVIAGNLKSTFLMSKYTLPLMVRNKGGVIINMGSTYGLMAIPNSAAYSTVKAAIIHLTKQMSLDYGRYNIRINCICPGPILTPGLEEHLRTYQNYDDVLAERKASISLGRFGLPEDIAMAALYLASEQGSFATGTILALDGGYNPCLSKNS